MPDTPLPDPAPPRRAEAPRAVERRTFAALDALYALVSARGTSFWRPWAALALVNLGAFFLYGAAVRSTTVQSAKATARSWWDRSTSWVGSIFSGSGGSSNAAPALTDAQGKALFDFTVASASPFGTTSATLYDNAVRTLFGAAVPSWIEPAQIGHGALNVVFVALLIVALRRRLGGRA